VSATAGPAAVDRFVVGTGRCGSTLLSLMLAEHRDVVSVHEFFTGLDWGRRFAPGLVSGAELAGIVGAEQPVTTHVLRRGYRTDEIVYPFGATTARYAVGDPVPWLLITMLSRLTDDPDPVFDDLLAFARARPPALLAEHYREVFAWTARRFGGDAAHWIERSGSSLDYLGDLVDHFPDARFVHIHRDGHEAALSIRAHRFFRLGVAILFDLFPADPDLTEDQLIDHVIETPPPLDAVGRYWSDQVLHGFRALGRLDRAQYLEVRFEDLLASPATTMGTIAAFLDLDADDGFTERAAALVGQEPAARFPTLTATERAELAAACRPGQILLGRA
jgi:hypothetical protein